MIVVDIKINGRTYKLSCAEEEQNNITLIGSQLDAMASEIIASAGQVNESLLLVMLAVLAKDEANLKQVSNTKNNNDSDIIINRIKDITQYTKENTSLT